MNARGDARRREILQAHDFLERSRLELHDEVMPPNQTESPLAALQSCKASIGKGTLNAEGIA